VPTSRKQPPPDDLASLLDEPAPRAWYRRRMVWAGALLLVLLVGGIGYWQAQKSANAAPAYQTQPVTRGNLSMTVTANGTLQPVRTTSIGSELSGTVLKVNVDVNDVSRKARCWSNSIPPSCATRFCVRAPPSPPPTPGWRRPPRR
jgi:HlyD family secretion protein